MRECVNVRACVCARQHVRSLSGCRWCLCVSHVLMCVYTRRIEANRRVVDALLAKKKNRTQGEALEALRCTTLSRIRITTGAFCACCFTSKRCCFTHFTQIQEASAVRQSAKNSRAFIEKSVLVGGRVWAGQTISSLA
jgi:hypothetical protein